MIDGLWTVYFDSNLNRFGQGVVVLNGGKILGGDGGYYYYGNYTVQNSDIQGDIEVIRFDPEYKSVIGDKDHFPLHFSGKILENQNRFEALAPVNENVFVKIVGDKKVDIQPWQSISII